MALFVAVGFVLAMSIVPPERTGRAISVVVSGHFVSTALGIALGAYAGGVAIGTFTASSAVITGLILR
jgi:DHA1 family inner membrane transport protein